MTSIWPLTDHLARHANCQYVPVSLMPPKHNVIVSG
jgi:hypothetical protein